jgi:hypothetical protein
MRLVIDLDPETAERLAEEAVREYRPLVWHAQVLIRRALGLEFPYPKLSPTHQRETPSYGSQVSDAGND